MLYYFIMSGLLIATGLFLLLANALKIPYLKTSKAVMNAGREDKKLSKTIEAVALGIASKLAQFIPMDKYKRTRLESTLKSAGIKMTPETFTALALLKSLCIALLAIPCAFIFPLVIPFVIILAVAVYFRETGKADAKMREKREAIEQELPRFVATVEQELKTSRDILAIMENFKKHAGVHFAYELDVTCADMRSSSYEAALTRFEARIGSAQLSDVVRGLVSVIRGDDSAVYFKMLSHDFKLIELQRLKSQAQKIPPKIRVFSFGMLMLFLLTYLFGLLLRWFVPGSFVSPAENFWQSAGYLVFPAAAIAIPRIAMTVKMLRSALLAEMNKDYVRTSYSRGNDRRATLYLHVLRNALPPVVSFLAMTVADIVAGSVVIEQVFAIPGLGRLLLTSISNRDYPVVQAVVVLVAFWVVLVNLLGDLLNQRLDPRLRLTD